MTVSSIVRRAGVSRGAQVHHYPNKQALMADTAQYLVHRTYRQLGELLLSISSEDNRLQSLVRAVWEQVFSTPLYQAYLELQVASRRDAMLATALSRLLLRIQQIFEPAIDHYFESAPDSDVNPRALFLQLSCILAGLASQTHLLGAGANIQTLLDLWTRQAALTLRARKGVNTPPPRPVALKA